MNHSLNRFAVQEDVLIPSEQWDSTVAAARHEERRGVTAQPVFRALGGVISGAACALETSEVDLAAFVEAARPPLDRAEIMDLVFGFNAGNQLVGNPCGAVTPREIMDQVIAGGRLV